jgi:hypothetical protein
MIPAVTLNQPGRRGTGAGFAERLLEVIDSGRRTAAYKLALLIALLDLRARHSDAGGRAPRLLYTRDIAGQVAVLYWPQVAPTWCAAPAARRSCGRSRWQADRSRTGRTWRYLGDYLGKPDQG